MNILPVILSGGSGTRLWPLSRKAYPKQFLPLTGRQSLFQQTCLRLREGGLDAAPLILANDAHRFTVKEQLEEVGVEPARILLEPEGRNTAPAALIAALTAAETEPEQLLLLLPSDHLIEDSEAFVAAVQQGMEAAQAGNIITFGVVPDAPETGYGYIHVENASGEPPLPVKRFVEKPDSATARQYLEDGSYYWNAGIFLVQASHLVRMFEQHAPELLAPCREALQEARTDLGFLRLAREAYAQCRDISIDYAILEKTPRVKCVPLPTRWNDLGSFRALGEVLEKDEQGNAVRGEALLHDSAQCVVLNHEGPLLGLLGLHDMVVAATPDAVLVAPRERAEDVRALVSGLQAEGRPQVLSHNRVYRPWGWYECLSAGERYQVKRLMIKPGARLSLQSHMHRAEHWVVVSGTARVVIDEDVRLLEENASIYIPIGARHRLENPGKLPLIVIEVQSGAYLGEDDIARYDDDYARLSGEDKED